MGDAQLGLSSKGDVPDQLTCVRACPSGYSRLGFFGDDVPGDGLMKHTGVSNMEDCASHCTPHADCGSFEWCGVCETCTLNAWNTSSTSQQTPWSSTPPSMTSASQLTCVKVTTTTTTTITTT